MKHEGISWRGVALGLAFQLFIIYWVAESEIAAKVFISSWSLTMTAVLLLLGLLAYNGVVRRWAPRWTLSRVELLVIFVMISATSVIYGYGMEQMLVPTLGGADYYDTPENNWAQLIHPYLPSWAVMRDEAVIKGLFEGNAAVPWGAWVRLVIVWGAFLMAAFGASLCFDLLLNRDWIRRERLTFPICSLPLEMTTPRWSFFRNRLMWLGFFIPAVLESLLALNYWYPAVPAVVMKHHDVSSWIVNRPWTAIRPLVFGWTPFVIGLAFLAPLEVSFSVWFFYWLELLVRVIGASVGVTDPDGGRGATDFPGLPQQTIGAFLAFGLYALWRSRRHLMEAVGSVFQGLPWDDADRRDELHAYRLGAAGLVLGLGFLFWFLAQLGLPVWVSGGVLTIYFVVCLTLARIRAEAGPAWAFGPDRDPHEVLVVALGTGAFSRRTLAMLGGLTWFFADVRFSPLPSQMEALKIGDALQVRQRSLAWVLLLATLVAIVAGFFACLHVGYDLGWATAKTYGAGRWMASWAWELGASWIRMVTDPATQDLPYLAFGGVFVVFLQLMRQRFLWWPFHPVGYVMAHTGASYSFWAHYIFAWTAKFLILRYGGMRLYRRALPFVVGVILGDIATQTLWSLFASLLGWPVYQFVS